MGYLSGPEQSGESGRSVEQSARLVHGVEVGGRGEERERVCTRSRHSCTVARRKQSRSIRTSWGLASGINVVADRMLPVRGKRLINESIRPGLVAVLQDPCVSGIAGEIMLRSPVPQYRAVACITCPYHARNWPGAAARLCRMHPSLWRITYLVQTCHGQGHHSP